MDTREKILLESMRLFAVHGFEATSVRAIAKEVGVANSALYRHFASKREIFDAIVDRCRERFIAESGKLAKSAGLGLEYIKYFCLDMYRFQTHDEWITLFRQMLLIEQFKSALMRETYHKFFVEMPVLRIAAVFTQLAEQRLIKNKDPYMLATQLYAPFYLHHLDEGAELDAAAALLKKHVDTFYEENLI